MANTELTRDALLYTVLDTLAESYNVVIEYMPETYTAADIMYQGDEDERDKLANSFIRALEDCIKVPAHEIAFVSFTEDNESPKITLNDSSSFELMTSIRKRRSWRASRSMLFERYFRYFMALGIYKTENAEKLLTVEDPLESVTNMLRDCNSPETARRLVGSLIPISNFINMEIDQMEYQIFSTSFFYTKCGNVDGKVDLPQKLLEMRRKNATTIRCIYDMNWIFDIRIRKKGSLSQHRIEWFLKDYPIGVVRQTTPINVDMPVPVRIQI